MNGTTVALETYLITAVISFVVAGLILVIRNLLSGDRKAKNKPKDL
jgi:hypothetical protein